MSFINKVKNFFYEDVEEDEEDELEEIRKREEKQRRREEKLKEKLKRSEEKIELPKEELKEEISERELFKSEKTFNFPMDMGDDIFDEEVAVKETKEEKPSYFIPREERKTISKSTSHAVSNYENISKYQASSEPKKFKPSPVVSPVYGVLDKNYTVEDVHEKNLSKTKEFSLEKKTVDFDSVRNKAYKELDDEIEKTLSGTKDIFYNLDDDEKESVNDYEEENDSTIDNNDSGVVITYDDFEEDVNNNEEESTLDEEIKPDINIEVEEESDFEEPDVEIPIVKKKRSTKKIKEDEEKEISKKEDLFNLIDNMYKDEDEEEDED